MVLSASGHFSSMVEVVFMMAVVMKMGLLLYQEIKTDTSYETATDMWLVDDFYNYQVVKEVVDELQ